MAEMRLDSVMYGIGNNLHDQFHRTNRLDLDPALIDQVYHERYNGGITGTTVSRLGVTAGCLSAQHGGMVDVEDGWSQRRGLCILKLTVVEDTLVETKMTILGYLSGGGNVMLGQVPDDVMFQPVRSWTNELSSGTDLNGRAMTKRAITENSQFLLASPTMARELKSIRPMDIVNYGIGFQDMMESAPEREFMGSSSSDLNNQGLIVSKAQNLNPISNAQTIMRHAASVSNNQVNNNMLSENMALSIGGMSDLEVYEHPFLSMMSSSLGMATWNGFIGFSFGEFRQVFEGFDRVLVGGSRVATSIAGMDHRLTSNELGTANRDETTANELAFITMHSLIDCGLLGLEFVASNAVTDLGVRQGIYFSSGTPISLLDNDHENVSKVERFKDYLEQSFFERYSNRKYGAATLIGVKVKCSIVGEITISMTYNNDASTEQNYSFPSYTINRTSSNIASSESQKSMAENYVTNLQEYFTS